MLHLTRIFFIQRKGKYNIVHKKYFVRYIL